MQLGILGLSGVFFGKGEMKKIARFVHSVRMADMLQVGLFEMTKIKFPH